MENLYHLYASSQCSLRGVTFSRSPGQLLDFFSGAGTLWRSCNGGNGWLEPLLVNTLYCSSNVLGGWGCGAGPCGGSPRLCYSVRFPSSSPSLVVVNLESVLSFSDTSTCIAFLVKNECLLWFLFLKLTLPILIEVAWVNSTFRGIESWLPILNPRDQKCQIHKESLPDWSWR